MSGQDLVPTHATFAPDQPVVLEWTGAAAPARLVVTRLGERVRDEQVPPGRLLDLGVLPVGGYAVRLLGEDEAPVTSAFDVLAAPVDRPRYGFLSEFGPGRSPEETAAASLGLRRLHLTAVQFYDWAYRHADLVGSAEEFTDICGRDLSHRTTRSLIAACREVGASAVGYAAVYGVAMDYAEEHPDQLLYHRDGTAYALADLLKIGNLAPDNPWHDHIIGQFRRAVDELGFDGLHLDTYGFPKIAWDHEGRPLDLAELFPPFLREVRRALPEATLFFNNVNDYPTWTSVAAPLDTTYVEVWDPHREYRHLVALIEAARLSAPGRPVVLAAYLVPFADGSTPGAEWAARLALATIWAHGGHHLLCGEGDGVLTHPYYPNFARVDAGTGRLLRDWFDFAVANGDLLHAPKARTITHSHLSGDENDDLAVTAAVPVSPDPVAGSLWVVARSSALGMTLHLIDLAGQEDLEWNRPKQPSLPVGSVTVRVRWAGERLLFGSPEHGPELVDLPAVRDGDYLVAELPAFTGWGLVHLPR
ncbi:glycoside hydrolase family 66 protein [Nocardioides panaciterrulae]|uniref:Dextranase n=1 Tax=Nocardioides panaciterrulae TaxID=661492 RepID=A0A7Y9J9G1_9ACTN|nr:glycoside hydrolase family 66 protein [Nocardioides panaciterrulae]NYD40071.1 dextranase [Nocardioides panaciterrulae]